MTHESGKNCKVNVQDVKVTYPVDGLIKYLPNEKAFGHASKYQALPKIIEGLNWPLI